MPEKVTIKLTKKYYIDLHDGKDEIELTMPESVVSAYKRQGPLKLE